MSMINDDYIRARFGKDLPQEQIDSAKTAMQQYGDNHWWESEDPVQVAMYQIFEKVLLVNFSIFHEGLEKLVGRPIFTHEFALNAEGLKEEARFGIERLKKGIGVSEEYKETALRKSIEMLVDYCKKTGKKLFKVDLTKELDKDENEIDHSGEDGWLGK